MSTLPITPKMQKLVDTYYDNFDHENQMLRDSVYKETYAEFPDMPKAKKQALALTRFMERKNVKVWPHDILAGQFQVLVCSSSLPIFENDVASFDPTHIIINHYNDPRNAQCEIDSLRPHMGELTLEEEEALEYLPEGIKVCTFAHYPTGHVITGYNNLIPKGINGIEKEIKESLKDPNKTEEQRTYLEAMQMTIDAVKAYIIRYADAAKEAMKETADKEQLEYLKRIEDACRNIAVRPPQDFFEAVQLTTLFQEMVTFETIVAMSLGRLDFIWGSYYDNDLKEGKINEVKAREIIDAFRLKLAGSINAFQCVTLGGVDKDGKNACNDVTHLFLESTRSIRYEQPMLNYRVTKDITADQWEDVMQVLEIGDGFPGLFNDELIIQAFINHGAELKDARNYAIVGCVETQMSGNEYTYTEGARVNWIKILELMLHDGKCTHFGDKIKMKKQIPLDEIKSVDELIAWWKEEVDYFMHKLAIATSLIEENYYKEFPATMLSLTMDNCVAKGEDVTGMGAKYRYSTLSPVGMGTFVDSIMAIKKVVFEEKMMTLSEFAKAVYEDNFEGHATLHNFVLNKCEKFGNDLPEGNALFKELIEWSTDVICSLKNRRGFHFLPGYYSAMQQSAEGQFCGASPDGRLAGTAFSNGMCPVQGMDVNGPTAVINSVTGPDESMFRNGMVLDLKFTPDFFTNPKHRKMFKPLVDTYFDKGGQEIQFNVVDRETLIAAQNDPEKYQNLIVRVSGFSAYFCSLAKPLQDEIINRTEYEKL